MTARVRDRRVNSAFGILSLMRDDRGLLEAFLADGRFPLSITGLILLLSGWFAIFGIVAKTRECASVGPRLKWPASDGQPKQLVDKPAVERVGHLCRPIWLAPSESCGPPR